MASIPNSSPANKATNPTPKAQTPPVNPPVLPVANPGVVSVQENPTLPDAPKATEKAAKAPKVKKPLYFDTEELAKTEAASRTEGARRPFKVEYNGKTYWMVVHNWEQAVANVAKDHGGATFTEIGKEAKVRGTEPATGASIAAMLEKLSETDRKQIEEALAKLKK